MKLIVLVLFITFISIFSKIGKKNHLSNIQKLEQILRTNNKYCTAYRSVINGLINERYPDAKCTLKCHNDESYNPDLKDNEPIEKKGCENIHGDDCQYKFDHHFLGEKYKLTTIDPELFFQAVTQKSYQIACKKDK